MYYGHLRRRTNGVNRNPEPKDPKQLMWVLLTLLVIALICIVHVEFIQ